MFEWNEDKGRLEALHHPFTAPNQDDLAAGDLRSARALAYDLVYNGVEVAGAGAWLMPLCGCTWYFYGFSRWLAPAPKRKSLCEAEPSGPRSSA